MKTCDVAIIGGGPAGTTAASMLKKYSPKLNVLILEREKFPREHVGESLLPAVNHVLMELGCWDKIEAANFPVKVGATYRWGTTKDLWDFEFLAGMTYEDPPRPAKPVGQRALTAWQVDRSLYDQILLDHARSYGVEVREKTKVKEVLIENGKVGSFVLDDGTTVSARFYIDASGASGIMRRALGIPIVEPTAIRNIAIWSYWQDTDWAVTVGASGTRIQIMSLGWGWMWFIPIGPTRTSLGLVVPADYLKKSGKRPEQLYKEAIEIEPRVKKLLSHAQREGKTYTTKDWSFLAERSAGENWFLIGEAAGFADPILSAGVSMAHVSGKEAAYTILEIMRGKLRGRWLREVFAARQARRIRSHIRFADYWYTANEQFTDLIEYTSVIAKEAGLQLDGKNAWQWLGTGGFVDEDNNGAGFGGYTLGGVRYFINEFSSIPVEWNVGRKNIFKLDLANAKKVEMPVYGDGVIHAWPAYVRGSNTLPTHTIYGFLIQTLQKTYRIDRIMQQVAHDYCKRPSSERPEARYCKAVEVLEAMVNDGFVKASFDPNVPVMDTTFLFKGVPFKKNTDMQEQAEKSA